MRYNVKSTPNAKEPSISLDNGIITAKVNAPPKEGRANERLIELLAEFFEVSPSQVKIVSGFTSRNKIIEITD